MTARMLGGVEAVRIVATRELRERLRSKALRWGTVAMLVISIGLALLPRVLPDATDPEWTVALSGDVPDGLTEAVHAIGDVESASITLLSTDLDPEDAVRRDDVDAVLVDGRVLLGESEIPERLQILLSSAVAQIGLAEELERSGVPPERAADLLTPSQLEIRVLEDDGDRSARQSVAFVGTVVLFGAIVTYGGWVMNSVLEEKANRIVEIVVSAIRPSELLAGKVLGVGALGLGQLALVVAVGTAAAAAAGTLPSLPEFVPGAVAASLAWFVLGYAFYAVGFAAAGSLTSRQEDASSAATPMILLATAAYFLAIILVNPDPDSTLARAVSFVPPITPIAMPSRMANGAVEAWEVAVAVAVMLVAIWLMIRVAARVYSNALLHTGGRVRALAALRSGGRGGRTPHRSARRA